MKTVKKPATFSYRAGMKRREFLGYVAATASITAIVSACNKNDNNNNAGIDLGSGDTGILNYAYALEQLEAAFYIQVLTTPYSGLSGDELEFLTDIRSHEIAHREFLKTVLATSAIPAVQVDFSSIKFSDRISVLTAAKTFEDLGVSAYNGAAQLLTSPNNLLIAGKIVSVEARHAAWIRDLLSYGSFADNTIVDDNGLDMQQSPDAVLAAAAPYLVTKFDTSHLPTN